LAQVRLPSHSSKGSSVTKPVASSFT